MIETTLLPPVDYHESSVDINLRFYQEGTKYSLQLLAEGQSLRRELDMTSHDLESLNQDLQKAMRDIAHNNNQQTSAQANLDSLTELGRFAFVRIFDDHDVRSAIEQLLASNQRCYIEIDADNFAFPWELICLPSSDSQSGSCCHFWGMNHIISRVISRDRARPGGFISPIISIDSLPTLGLLIYDGLSGANQESHLFSRWQDEGKLSLFCLRPLDPEKRREELQEFQRFWSNTLNLAHFACHAFYNSSIPHNSYLLLSEEFEISLRDITNQEIYTNGHPLIVMNACETGELTPHYTSSFAAHFLKCGARGVVATECAVPDTFAADFSNQLYTQLLEGKSLGECLLAVRQYFFQEYGNPSGLLYSMYAPPTIRLVQSGDSNG